MLVEALAQALAGDEAGAGEIEIQVAEDALARQFAREVLDGIEVAGHIAAADDGADRSARHDVGLDAGLDESLEDANMGPAARRAAAQRQSDLADAHGSSPSFHGRSLSGRLSAGYSSRRPCSVRAGTQPSRPLQP